MLDELKQMQVKKSEEKKAIIENTDEITRLKKQLDVYLEKCADGDISREEYRQKTIDKNTTFEIRKRSFKF
ncbi:hypothetical protein [Kandleria vitulina]|uniref:hypothetical protein n=1 Tax=Kandleria vitulina TaxID=1630 RepID=UPI0009440CA6|nr:hypothetical protein [Kandleria vitulina]